MKLGNLLYTCCCNKLTNKVTGAQPGASRLGMRIWSSDQRERYLKSEEPTSTTGHIAGLLKYPEDQWAKLPWSATHPTKKVLTHLSPNTVINFRGRAEDME